ncbi:MAG: hypothetical protein ABIF87_03255 [Pseudomonadota bacterium]
MKKSFLLFCMGVLVSGCAGINYSHVCPEAHDFHPQTIAVLPVMVGNYQSAEGVADNAVSQALVDTGLFTSVIDASSLREQLSASRDLSADVSEYIQKLNTLGVSDKELAQKIADTLNVDALFLTYVTSWGYGRLDGNKVGRSGLGIKLICGKTGLIMWKANHEEVESYWFIKPDLAELSEEVLEPLLAEMPH